jgi:hypothetical protein
MATIIAVYVPSQVQIRRRIIKILKNIQMWVCGAYCTVKLWRDLCNTVKSDRLLVLCKTVPLCLHCWVSQSIRKFVLDCTASHPRRFIIVCSICEGPISKLVNSNICIFITMNFLLFCYENCQLDELH